MKLRVILADDHPFVLLGIQATLAGQCDVRVVGEATSPSSLSLSLLGTGTIKVTSSSSSSVSIVATSSKGSDLQVGPNSQTVSAGGSATFTLKSKKAIGVYSVTFSTPCGSKTVPVIVVL